MNTPTVSAPSTAVTTGRLTADCLEAPTAAFPLTLLARVVSWRGLCRLVPALSTAAEAVLAGGRTVGICWIVAAGCAGRLADRAVISSIAQSTGLDTAPVLPALSFLIGARPALGVRPLRPTRSYQPAPATTCA